VARKHAIWQPIHSKSERSNIMRSKYILISLSVVAALAAVVAVVSAGDPDNPPGPPETTSSYTLEDIYDRLATGAAGTQVTFTEPTSGPTVGTGHTLDEIMAVAPQVDDTDGATAAQVLSGETYWSLRSWAWGLQAGTMPNSGAVTITPTTIQQTIAMGYHNGSGYVEGDADLVSGNIRSGVSIFGVAGDPNVVNTASGDAAAGDILSAKKAWVDGTEVTGSMPDNGAVAIVPTTANQTIVAGYHNGSGYVEGDTDLVAGNIKGGVSVFGVHGTLYAPVPKTGQTTSYASGDDGDLEMGVAWPSPRFITGTTGTAGVTVVVTDTLTGLVWLQDANCIASEYPSFDTDGTPGDGQVDWQPAMNFVAGMTAAGSYSNCAAGFSDWRLPNVRELYSLVDYGEYDPALPDGHPFTGVQTVDGYWSSTSHADETVVAWVVFLLSGRVDRSTKEYTRFVWPVRGG
jgi:hypothetical protein